jgi:hypothetical protein
MIFRLDAYKLPIFASPKDLGMTSESMFEERDCHEVRGRDASTRRSKSGRPVDLRSSKMF